MRNAVIASAFLHAGVLAATFFDWPFLRAAPPDLSPPIPVELVTVAEATHIPRKMPQPKKVKVEPDKTPQAKAQKTPPPPPPPPPEPVAEETPKPKPEPKPEAKPEPAPKPKLALKEEPKKVEKAEKTPPKPAPKKQSDVKPKPQQKKPRVPPNPESKDAFDPSKIAALLDKSVKEETPKTDENFEDRVRQALEVEPTNAPPSENEQLTVNELDALRQRLARCWSIPAGAQEAENLVVKLHIWLNPDGTLARPPEVVNNEGSEYFRIAAESAQRAVYACQDAFSILPQEKYGTWRDIILNFDPKEMLQG